MEDIKLGKCPNCKSAFYVKTKEEKEVELVCPICKKLVHIELKISENGNNGTS